MPVVELCPPRHAFVAVSKVLANTSLKIVHAYMFLIENCQKTKSFLLVNNAQIRVAAPDKRKLQF
jgi:hypothetical protein